MVIVIVLLLCLQVEDAKQKSLYVSIYVSEELYRCSKKLWGFWVLIPLVRCPMHFVCFCQFTFCLLYQQLYLTCLLQDTVWFVFVFHCCVANYHTLSGLNEHKFTISQFWWVRNPAWFHCNLCSGSHKAKLTVLGGTGFPPGAQGHLPGSFRLLTEFNLCSCRTDGNLFLHG